MTLSLVLRVVAVWFVVSVPFSMAVGAWLRHADRCYEDVPS